MDGLLMKDTFTLGCNYWASHAGIDMWTDWKPEVIDKDFEAIAAHGLNCVRVFPLWSEFQPIENIYTAPHVAVEVRINEQLLENTPLGRAGISVEMMERFSVVLQLAEKHGLKVIVGLITGWMSGRLYFPPALAGLNLLENPTAIMWEVRFVKAFVNYFKENKQIIAWELGNETNCLDKCSGRAAAMHWATSIADAVYSHDRSRPMISGMHSLTINGNWAIEDQSEATDLLTTHPYPVFTPYCFMNPVDTMKTGLHATAESAFYSDIGGKPCLVEEIGTLGNMVASNDVAGSFARSNLFSQWANGLEGFLWWCAFDQNLLTNAPYDWNACERELGMFFADGRPKPVAEEMKKFSAFLKDFPYENLPQKQRDAVCILTNSQDHWGVAFSSYILAKQAGFDITFAKESRIPKAKLYFMPSIREAKPIYKQFYDGLLKEVADGAVLYISVDAKAFLTEFETVTGNRILCNTHRRNGVVDITFDSGEVYTMQAERKLTLESITSTVLAREAGGNPAFTVNEYGKGKIYFLNFPMEMNLAKTPESFGEAEKEQYFNIYKTVIKNVVDRKVTEKSDPNIGVTEHVISEDRTLIVAINYAHDDIDACLTLQDGWKVARQYYGSAVAQDKVELNITIQHNDAVIFEVSK